MILWSHLSIKVLVHKNCQFLPLLLNSHSKILHPQTQHTFILGYFDLQLCKMVPRSYILRLNHPSDRNFTESDKEYKSNQGCALILLSAHLPIHHILSNSDLLCFSANLNCLFYYINHQLLSLMIPVLMLSILPRLSYL